MGRVIARKIIQYRWCLVVLIFGLTGFFAFHLKDISIYQQLTDIAPERHPYVQLNRYMGQVFGGYALVSITLEVVEGDIFAREVLEKLVRLQKRLERLTDVVPGGVYSIVSRALKHTTYTTDEYGYPAIQVENINYMVDRVLEGDAETYKKYRQFLLNNERVYGSIISPDKKAALIQAQFFSDRDYWYLFQNIRKMTQDEEDANTRFYLSGRPIAMGHLYVHLKKMVGLFAVAIGITMLLLLLAFGTVRGIVIPLWAGLVTVIWGIMRLEVGELQPGEPIFWQDSEYNRAEEVNNRFRGTNPYLIYIAGQKEYDLWGPEIVKEVYLLQRHLDEMEGVKGSRSYVDVLLGMNRAYHNDDPRWEVLPQEPSLIAEFLDRFAHSGGPETARPYFEIDHREASLVLFVKDHQGKTIRRLLNDTNHYLANNHSSCVDIKVAAGIIGVYAAIMDEIKGGQVWNLLQISIAIFLFCLLTFRSLSISLIIILTLGLGTIITYAVMGYGNIGLFIYTLPIASLGMGLGVDYAIYVISRLREELVSERDYQEAWIKAMTTSGKAILFTALSVAIGGFTLLLSSIRFQAIMGGMLTVVVFANMLGALFLLPTLINLVRPALLKSS